ncbi:hypothetical protein LCGC14_1843640, partial [marine sediment metagenome]
IDTLLLERPDIVGFTAMSNQIEYVKEWSKWIKFYNGNMPIICGGVHATLNPDEVLGFEGIDVVCIGEGEQAILEFIKSNRKQAKYNIMTPAVKDLDRLPYPDYSIFDYERMLKARNGNFAVIASRGCPYQCNYCCNHALSEKHVGQVKYFRYHSVDYILNQLEMLVAKYPIKSFSFADDIFGINKKWVYEFCEKYPRQIGLGFECNLRAESATPELLEALKSANCTKVEMGIESGNYWMRRVTLNRNMTDKQIIEAFANARKLGIKTRAYNMIGLPFETPGMVKETINLNKKIAPDQVAVFYFYPYKGTKLYDVCNDEGFLSDKKTTSYLDKSVLFLPSISVKDLKKLHDEFYRYVMDREVRGYPLVLRYAFKVAGALLRCLTCGNEVKLIINGYMKLFGVFQWLKS